MRVVFAGTPSFARPALEAIVTAGHEVSLVLTQPDRPAGRGMRLAPSSVSEAANQFGLPLSKPASLRSEAVIGELHRAHPDVIVVAAYGLILPQPVLDLPPRGCINIHASLLPRWRGAAPVHRAILAGDERTGVSIMRMEAGLDTGPVLLEESIPIEPRDTTGSLTGKLSRLGAEAVVQVLDHLDTLVARPQDASLATYAPKIDKSEALLDWSLPAGDLARRVRALNPSPGAEAFLGTQRIKVWEADPVAPVGPPGQLVVADGEPIVGCGQGALRLLVVQRPGGRRMPATEFLRGAPATEPAANKTTH